jgi:hypothetical protein
MVRLLSVPLAALIYAITFHYSYAIYINPAFAYAHYEYHSPELSTLLLTYSLVLAPLVLFRRSIAPAACGAALIYVLCYVPAQLILLFMWDRLYAELAVVQGSLAGSMTALMWAARLGMAQGAAGQSIRRVSWMLPPLTVVSLLILVVVYREHMRLVSFADVYDLRFEASEVETNALIDYPLLWLSYCFLPFYIARGILRKSLVDLGVAFAGSVLIYATSGAKAALLMPFIIFGVHVASGKAGNLLLRLLVLLTLGLLLIIVVLPNQGVLLWVKSILLVRVLGTGGWTIATYYDYFSTHGFTFYTHIGPINALTDAYPYGELSLGQLIGIEYSGSARANFNANFWASDGFAAAGVAGVPAVTVVLCGVFYAINWISRGYSIRFVTLWLCGFWLALLNVPLTTALLSGGGAITLLLLWAARGSRSRVPATMHARAGVS